MNTKEILEAASLISERKSTENSIANLERLRGKTFVLAFRDPGVYSAKRLQVVAESVDPEPYIRGQMVKHQHDMMNIDAKLSRLGVS